MITRASVCDHALCSLLQFFYRLLDAFRLFKQRFDLTTLLVQRPLNSPIIAQDNAITNAGFVQCLKIGTPPMVRA